MKKFFLVSMGLLSCIITMAQQGNSRLTFQEAIKIAIQNNVNVNQQKNQLWQNQSQKVSSIAQLGPQIAIGGSAFRRDGNSFNQQRGEVVNGTLDVISGQLGVDLPIFNGMSGFNNARQSSALVDAQMHFVKRTTQDVMNTVSTQYLQVLLDQQLLTIANENLDAQKKQYDQVKEQVDLGSRSPVDEFNQKAQMMSAELRVVQAEIALKNDKNTLLLSLQLDPLTEYELDEPGWDVNGITMDSLELNSLVQIALENRSDYKRAQLTEKASQHSMQASRGSYMPSLSAFYNYGSAYNNVSGTPDSLARNFDQQFFSDNTYQTIGLSLNIPIFTGFQNRSNYVRNKVTYENNKISTKNSELTVKSDVIRSYQNFQAIQQSYAASLAQLEAAQQAYHLEQQRFELGITSFVDFANANRTYVQAQTDMAQARYRLLFQKILLDYSLGTLKVEDIP